MCGILAASYKESRSLTDISKLIKNMEYRGYDSWGLVTLGEKVKLYRALGMINRKQIVGKTKLVLAHTRWATHGGIKIKNCHPFFSCDKNIWLVHNGIVENYTNLRIKNHRYNSETDSETMVHFLEKYQEIESGVRNLAEKIKGKNSLVVFSARDNKFIGFRRGSPLIVGKGSGVGQIVSDSVAFDKGIEKIYHLNDEEMITIDSQQKIKILNLLTNKEVNAQWENFSFKKQNYAKSGAMYRELKEGVEVIKRIDEKTGLIRDFKNEVLRAKEVILLGCGSAGVAAEMGAKLIALELKKRATAYSASEIGGYIESFDKKALVIVLSQSGETMDLIETTEIFLKNNFRVLGLTNNPLSTLARMVEKNYPLLADKEVAVVATKSFVGMIYWFFKICGIQEKMEFKEKEAIKLAKRLVKRDKLLIIGRGENLILAKEAAIKLKEACYIQSEAIGGGELKHGTLALVEKGVLVLAIGNKLENDIAEIKARGGEILEINNSGIISNLWSIQLLAYYLAKYRGINPDRPRNLAKSVTVK